jgi:16S rRNA (adenine1518-N6/adenine1519-N6)-dimethyltransferase
MNVRRKTLGQHFLNNPRLAERIARAGDVAGELVVEIGAGKGILTRQLAQSARKVIAVEIDPRLARFLEGLGLPGVEVLNRDFLKLRDFAFPVVVGNIPYSITSAIIEKLILGKDFLKRAVLTVQKEYGAKMTASAGDRDHGYLSVCLNYHFEVHRQFTVSARYFSPRPRVSSAVVVLEPKKGLLPRDDEAPFFEFAAGVFRYRRKSVKNAVLSHLPCKPKMIKHPFLDKRPQDLSIDDLYLIYNMISGKR